MAKKPTPTLDLDDFEDLMAAVADQDYESLDIIDEITLRICSYWPTPAYQAIVKFRNRLLPWASFVHRDPLVAQTTALDIALRGPQAIEKESRALFHPKKEVAQDIAHRLLKEYPDILVLGRVELEPMQGWVAVVFTRRGYDPINLKELAGVAEVREIEDANEPPRRRSSGKPIPAPKTAKGAGSGGVTSQPETRASKAPSTASGDRSGMTKSALIKEHKELFGKQPNNKLSKEEIIELIESKLGEAPAADEDEENLL